MFDPTEPKWGVKLDTFPPNKESAWAYPPEEDGWTHSHNALRMELAAFAEALEAMLERGAEPADWELHAIKKWWGVHEETVHAHHHSEDEIMNPFLRTRIKLPEKLEADHVELVRIVDELSALISNLKSGASSISQIQDLAALWKEYDQTMRPHLLEEEAVGLPLFRAYFTPKEAQPQVMKIVEKDPRGAMGSFIFCMGEDKFRTEFMKQHGIPFFVWYIDFRSKFLYYKNEIAALVDALTEGKPPAPPPATTGFTSFAIILGVATALTAAAYAIYK